MPKYNENAYRLTAPFDPLAGNAPLPEEIRARDLHTIRNPAALRHDNVRAVVAGSRVGTRTRVSGGTFAPRATSGMS